MDILTLVLNHDNYERVPGIDMSVTEISNKTRYQKWHITNNHKKTYKVKPGDRISSILGTGFHAFAEEALENTPGVECETKLIGDISGVRIGGTADIIKTVGNSYIVGDFKTKGTVSMKKALKDELDDVIAQLSIYSYLYSRSINVEYSHLGEVYLVHVGDRGYFSKTDAAELGFEDGKVPKYITLPVVLLSEEEVEELVENSIVEDEPDLDCQEWMCNWCEFKCDMRMNE